MDITIRLPGRSPQSDRSLAPQAARLAVLNAQGLLAAASAPPAAQNACGPGCKFLGEIVDDDGMRWFAYDCDGVLKLYPA